MIAMNAVQSRRVSGRTAWSCVRLVGPNMAAILNMAAALLWRQGTRSCLLSFIRKMVRERERYNELPLNGVLLASSHVAVLMATSSSSLILRYNNFHLSVDTLKRALVS
jgi:hypothetical protein